MKPHGVSEVLWGKSKAGKRDRERPFEGKVVMGGFSGRSEQDLEVVKVWACGVPSGGESGRWRE